MNDKSTETSFQLSKDHDLTAKPTIASFYSGAGGLDLGFINAGYQIKFANDIDAIAIQTHNFLHQTSVAVAGDVNKIDLSNALGADVVIGGPPCQGFSVAGRMDPLDTRSRHVWKFLELVGRIKPKVFLMENVKNLYSNARWAEIRMGLIMASQALGYSTSLSLLNAADFSTPQSRERMFLIGVRGDLKVPALKPPRQSKLVSVRDALSKIPRYGSGGNNTFCTAKITAAANPVLRKSPYAGMLFNGAGRPLNLERPSTTLAASMGGNRTPIVEQNLLDGETDSWIRWYHGRLREGEPPIPFDESVSPHLRRLTVEEAAVIQGFPVGMKFSGSSSAQFRQIGNSVAPPIAEAVARHIMPLLELAGSVPNTRSFDVQELMAFAGAGASLRLF